jgi:hypothetical protein
METRAYRCDAAIRGKAYLAEFVAWYADSKQVQPSSDIEDDADDNGGDRRRPSRTYRKHDVPRVIRYRHYELDETFDHFVCTVSKGGR